MSRKSDFQFTNPALLKISYEINKEFSADEEKQIQIEVKTETNVGMADSGNEAFVILRVEIGGREKELPFWIEAEEGASFRWNADILSKSEIDGLLKQNAPALLLSYLRSTVAMVTAASPLGTYNIPFMNFTYSEDAE